MMVIIYTLLAAIDRVIYGLASSVFGLISDLANTQFFTDQQITTVANRIYIVVGVLMLFKLVISAVQYMINPDTFEDKEKGLTGVLARTAISIGLVVLVPSIFKFLIMIQEPVIKSLPDIVLGPGTTEKTDEKSIGFNLSFKMLSVFITVNENSPNKAGAGVGEGKEIHDFPSFVAHAADDCPAFTIFGSGDSNDCQYSYMILISTACGGFLVYILLSMALDIAIRTIKFGIIQILAPIPITGYVFKKDRLTNFVKKAVSVYLDLFIRMLIVYFIIFAIKTMILDNKLLDLLKGDHDPYRNVVANVVIIIGLLMFAKNAPKFISELLGLPDVGSGDLADMFKPAWQRAGALGAVGGMFTAAAGNAINKAKFTKWEHGKGAIGKNLKNAAKVAGSGIAGAASAGFHGGIAAAQGKTTREVNAAGYKRAIRARQNRDLDKLNKVGPIDRTRVKMGDMLGIDTKASLAENKQKAYSTLHSDVGAYKKAVMGRIVKNADVSIRTEIKENGALDQLGSLLNQNRSTIMASRNRDLINFLNKFEMKTYTDDTGNIKNAWGLKANQTLSYHDLAAIHADATQAGIGSVAGVTGENGALTLLAQKELFTDAMHDRVMRTNGTSMDEINVNSGSTHVDITTVFQAAKQHLAENAVPLGESAESLQSWFSGTVTDPNSPHYKKDFNNMDDTFQKKSAELSGEMSTGSTGREAAARASLERRNANKDKK